MAGWDNGLNYDAIQDPRYILRQLAPSAICPALSTLLFFSALALVQTYLVGRDCCLVFRIGG